MAGGILAAMPCIRTHPEDFFVEEIPLYPPQGHGSHTHLLIEKRLRNTHDLLRDLARALGLPRREVGYAGRKDRIAVTRQWFSVPVTGERLADLELGGAEVVARERHPERLRVGQLWGNRFCLAVREVDEQAARRAAEILDRLHANGLPNRFGRQRFGRDGQNAARGLEILATGRLLGGRRKALLMLSALQSEVFNRVLAGRSAPLDELLPGDLAVVHATGELLPVADPAVADPAALAERAARFEVSATGPIFGTKMRSPRGAAAELEAAAMAAAGLPTDWQRRLPRGLKLFGGRRPLRVRPRDAGAEWADGVLRLAFELPAGSYATVLLEELFPEGFDEGPAPRPPGARVPGQE